MNNDKKIQNLEEQIQKLKSDVEALSQNFYKNNFSSVQIFNKSSNFTLKLKVPHYTTFPACQVGEVSEVGGKLYICSAVDTWTIVGTQS